jgi:hypothetical protein
MYTPLNGDSAVGDTGYTPSSTAQRRVHDQHLRQQQYANQRNDHDDSIADFTINSATVFKTPNLPGASQNRRRRRVRQRLPNVPWPLAFFICAILTPVAGVIMFGIGVRERYEQYKKAKALRTITEGDYRSFPSAEVSDALYRRIFENDGDWLVVVCVGILYQTAVLVPIYIAADKLAYTQIVDDLHVTGDYYGAFALAPAMGFYLNITVYLFGFLESRYEGIDEDSLLATQIMEDENGSFISGDHSTPSGAIFSGGGGIVGRNSYNSDSHVHFSQNNNRPVRSTVANTVVVGQQGITLSAKSLRTAVNIRRTIREATLVHTELTILVAFVIGTFEMLATRLCALSATPCDTLFTFQDARFSTRHYYAMTSIFWVCLFSVFNICVIYAVTVYYQQLLQLREFRYANGGRQTSTAAVPGLDQGWGRQGASSPTTSSVPVGGSGGALRPSIQQRLDQALKPLEDLSSPESISIWTFTWQQFILDIKRKPLTVATTTSTFLALVATILGCTFYIAIFNLQAKGSEVAEFTTPLAAVMAFAAFCMGVFVYVTVQVSNAVDVHTKTIAQLQNDTQVRVNDEGDSYAGKQKQLLLAKVRVLQSLDIYLRHSDSRPKLVGMSVESLRWTVIIIGLVILNACFFGLYYSWCYQS